MSFLNWKNLLFVAIIATGSLYYIVHISNSKSDSTSGRLFALQQVTKQIMQKPIGYGINSFSTEYNKAKASRILHVDYKTLHKKLKEHAITTAQFMK
jgi:DNA-binding NtrC family response regulator